MAVGPSEVGELREERKKRERRWVGGSKEPRACELMGGNSLAGSKEGCDQEEGRSHLRPWSSSNPE